MVRNSRDEEGLVPESYLFFKKEYCLEKKDRNKSQETDSDSFISDVSLPLS